MRLDECRGFDDFKTFQNHRSYDPDCREECYFTVEFHPENLTKGFSEVVKVISVDCPGTSFFVSDDMRFFWKNGGMNKDFRLPLFTARGEALDYGTEILKQAFLGASKELEKKMGELGKRRYE